MSAVIEETVIRTGRDFNTVASELLAEGARMRLHPGIVFADGPFGRRALLAGTALDVASIIGQYNYSERNWQRLQEAFPELSQEQFETALRYADAYYSEITRDLEAENLAFFEGIWAKHPQTRPPWR